jgi:hypothetical protein
MITNREQMCAYDLVKKLGDKKKNAFGMYMRLIKKFGEQKCRSVLSEVLYETRGGRIRSKVKLFMFKIKL